jgi:surface antigen Omp85-like protein
MRTVTFPLLIISLLMLTGCTSLVPRDNLFYPVVTNECPEHAQIATDSISYPVATKKCDDKVKVVTIPLPVIASSPNEGVTTGALTAFLVHNDRDEVTSLVAPQINFNPNFGTTLTLYGVFYPALSRTVEFNLSHSTRVNEDYEARIRDLTLLGGKLESNLFLYHFTDGSSRFFGLGPGTLESSETNFGAVEDGFTYTAAYPLSWDLYLQLGERLRKARIRTGAIEDLPFTKDRFTESNAPGLNGFTAHAQKIAILYNSLDSICMPLSGGYARMSLEGSTKGLGSEADYLRYEFEAKGFIPKDADKRFITAFRFLYSQVPGRDVPFMERASLGGENTLRGYGRNRFIDSTALIFNLEERIRLFRWTVFDVNADWEFAPFIDIGAVSGSVGTLLKESFKFNPGFGLRAVVRPNIVGRIDAGWGKEGLAVFVGLGYPF